MHRYSVVSGLTPRPSDMGQARHEHGFGCVCRTSMAIRPLRCWASTLLRRDHRVITSGAHVALPRESRGDGGAARQ